MLTREQVLKAIEDQDRAPVLDGRDFLRLADFMEEADLPKLGFERNSDEPWRVKPWTEEAIKEQLKLDVAFGFEKALNQRGISASLMSDVVKMWLWVLEDELQNHGNYAQYGLPLLKAVAVKYGFPNEIGDDDGDEDKYAG